MYTSYDGVARMVLSVTGNLNIGNLGLAIKCCFNDLLTGKSHMSFCHHLMSVVCASLRSLAFHISNRCQFYVKPEDISQYKTKLHLYSDAKNKNIFVCTYSTH